MFPIFFVVVEQNKTNVQLLLGLWSNKNAQWFQTCLIFTKRRSKKGKWFFKKNMAICFEWVGSFTNHPGGWMANPRQPRQPRQPNSQSLTPGSLRRKTGWTDHTSWGKLQGNETKVALCGLISRNHRNRMIHEPNQTFWHLCCWWKKSSEKTTCFLCLKSYEECDSFDLNWIAGFTSINSSLKFLRPLASYDLKSCSHHRNCHSSHQPTNPP